MNRPIEAKEESAEPLFEVSPERKEQLRNELKIVKEAIEQIKETILKTGANNPSQLDGMVPEAKIDSRGDYFTIEVPAGNDKVAVISGRMKRYTDDAGRDKLALDLDPRASLIVNLPQKERPISVNAKVIVKGREEKFFDTTGNKYLYQRNVIVAETDDEEVERYIEEKDAGDEVIHTMNINRDNIFREAWKTKDGFVSVSNDPVSASAWNRLGEPQTPERRFLNQQQGRARIRVEELSVPERFRDTSVEGWYYDANGEKITNPSNFPFLQNLKADTNNRKLKGVGLEA